MNQKNHPEQIKENHLSSSTVTEMGLKRRHPGSQNDNRNRQLLVAIDERHTWTKLDVSWQLHERSCTYTCWILLGLVHSENQKTSSLRN